MRKKKLKIFLGLSEVSGLYQGLEQGFKELNITVTRLDLANHPFKYVDHKKSALVSLFQSHVAHLSKKKSLKKYYSHFICITCKLILFLSALIKHNIFIFSYGTSFFRLKELIILKLFRKKIIFQFHGSDSRPPFMDGTLIHDLSIDAIAKLTAKKKRQMTIINRYADAIIDIPPMGLFHEKSFINWLQVGLTVNITEPPATIIKKNNEEKIRVLHAPSNPRAKGTDIIEHTINRLIQEGYRIELVKIHNQPNSKVKEALKHCDFVIDQLFADYPMPGFATESAWFAKPIIICGYATELWNELLPDENKPPTYYCHPEKLEESIKNFCDDIEFRTALGKRAFDFVSKKWSPEEVAKRYLRIICNDVPDEWYCHPQDIRYTHGCCVKEDFLRAYVSEYITVKGKSALCLQDKPELERLFLEFAGSSRYD